MTTNEEAFRTAVFPSTDAPQAIPRSALPETPVLVVSHLTVGAEDPARPPLLTDLTLSIGAGETRLSERHELEKPERLDGVGLFTVLDLELK